MRTVAVIAAVAVALATASASAQRVVVAEVAGRDGPQVRAAIVRGLAQQGAEVIQGAELDASAPETSATRLASSARAQAVVTARVSRQRRWTEVRAEVRDGATGRVIDARSSRAPSATRAAQRLDHRALAAAIDRGSAPSPLAPRIATPASAAQPPAWERGETSPEPAAASTAPGPEILDLAVGVGLGGRELAFRDDLRDTLSDHAIPAAPEGRLRMRYFPGAHFGEGPWAHLGLELRLSAMALVTSEVAGANVVYDNEAWSVLAGLVGRARFESLRLGAGLGFGEQVFRFAPRGDAPRAGAPDVDYVFVRPSATVGVDLPEGFEFDGELAWRFLLDSGELGRWFPRSEGYAFDLGVGAGWRSDTGLGVRLAFEFDRAFFAMHSRAEDERIAGGAHDQRFAVTLQATYRVR